MNIGSIRQCCLNFPHATENLQWGADLCFKVGGKLFAVAAFEMVPQRISFKCTAERFAELCELPDIIPAPYMARAQWVSLLRLDAVRDAELRELLAESYRLVWERLPKRLRAELEEKKFRGVTGKKTLLTSAGVKKPRRKGKTAR